MSVSPLFPPPHRVGSENSQSFTEPVPATPSSYPSWNRLTIDSSHTKCQPFYLHGHTFCLAFSSLSPCNYTPALIHPPRPTSHLSPFYCRVLGSLAPLYDLEGFIAGQTPHVDPPSAHPSSLSLAYQLGNLYSLLFLIGVAVLHTSTEPKVVRNYLVAYSNVSITYPKATMKTRRYSHFTVFSSTQCSTARLAYAISWNNFSTRSI